METTREREAGLLDHILPPRLEDAGLEDCALHPDSIKEAFFKAATAVKSGAASVFSSEDECVRDPWPTAKGGSDVGVGISPEFDLPGPCGAGKGGVVVEGKDKVVFGRGEDLNDAAVDKVLGPEVKEGKGKCVDGSQGLDTEDGSKSDGVRDVEEGKEDRKPILAEGFV